MTESRRGRSILEKVSYKSNFEHQVQVTNQFLSDSNKSIGLLRNFLEN